MKKNSFKQTIEFVGLSYKKELLKIILVNALTLIGGIIAYLFTKNIVIPIVTFIVLGLLDFFLLTRYSDKKKAILKNRENELIAIISYFEVYIQNNSNVYQ